MGNILWYVITGDGYEVLVIIFSVCVQVQVPSRSNLQNAMYNGWLHSDVAIGTICFASDGCIIWVRHNCPQSWNDQNSMGFNLLDKNLCPD